MSVDFAQIAASAGAALFGVSVAWGAARALGQSSAARIEAATRKLEGTADLLTRVDERVAAITRNCEECRHHLDLEVDKLRAGHQRLRTDFMPVVVKCETLWSRSGLGRPPEED